MRKYYVGLDVHKVTIAIAVLDAHGKLITRTVIETSTEAVRDFFRNLGGEIHLTFEEGNHAAWLYDIVEPLVRRVVACNPNHKDPEEGSLKRAQTPAGGSKKSHLPAGRDSAQVRGKYQMPLCHMSSESHQAAPKDQA
ncbi:MAG: hypothetical protein M3410_06820 [Acidobacteriota bacterium]|nr:hypothetical protein [Acidobacteriota bacterium]